MIAPLIKKYKNHPHTRYFSACSIIILLYILYKIYVWSNTQSTDNAYIEADVSLISSEVSGVIKTILVIDNSKVNAGDVIPEINDADFKANLAKAESDITAAMHDIEVIDQK